MKSNVILSLIIVTLGSLPSHWARADDIDASQIIQEPPLATHVPVDAKASVEKAVSSLEDYTQKHSDDTEAWYALGIACLAAKDYDKATNALKQAATLDAKERSEKGQTFTKTDLIRRVWGTLGYIELSGGRLDLATAAFKKALEIDPTYGAAWNNLGVIQEKQRNYDEAATDFKTALQYNPEFAVAWANLAQAYVNKQQWQDAHDAALHSIGLAPDYLNALLLLGESSFQIKDWETAVESYHKAWDELDARHKSFIKVDHDFALALREYGTACINIHHFDDAEKILNEAKAIAPQDADILAAVGLVYVSQGRWSEVIASFQQAVALNPNLLAAWYGIGATNLEHLNNPTDAIPAYEQAVKLKPDFVKAWQGLGIANQQLKKNDDAAAAFRKTTELEPANVDAWRRLALVTSDPAESDKALAQAFSLDAKDVGTFAIQGELNIRRKDWPAAEKSFRDALAIKPDDPIYWSMLGNTLFSQKKFSDAASADETALQKGTSLPPARIATIWGTLAEAHMAQGHALGTPEWQAAVDALNHAVALVPNSSDFWFEMYACQKILGNKEEASTAQARWLQLGGQIPHMTPGANATAPVSAAPATLTPVEEEVNAIKTLLQGKQFDEALKRAQDDTVSHPELALSWYSLGDVLFVENRSAEAIADLTKANAIDPKMGPNWYDLGCCLAIQGNINDATPALIKAVDLMPEYPRGWEMLTRCYRAQKNLGAGEEEIQSLVNAHPESPYGWGTLGEIQTTEQMPAKALPNLQKAVALKSDYAQGWNSLGLAYGHLQQSDQALDAFNHAIQAQPGYDEALNNLGYTYFLAGQMDKAIDAYKQALQSNPNHKRALINLTTAYAKENQWGPARDTCAILAKIDPRVAAQLSQSFPSAGTDPAPSSPTNSIPATPSVP